MARGASTMTALLLILGVIVLVAVFGGLLVHNLFWLVLILGLGVFAWAALTGRITE
jgi:hypothetical protein